MGAWATPVPDNGTTCGLPGASSVMMSVPVRVPVAVGVDFTEAGHLPVPVREGPPPVGRLKSPVTVTLAMASAVRPLFRVRVCAVPVAPTATVPKLTAVAENARTVEFEVPVPVPEGDVGVVFVLHAGPSATRTMAPHKPK